MLRISISPVIQYFQNNKVTAGCKPHIFSIGNPTIAADNPGYVGAMTIIIIKRVPSSDVIPKTDDSVFKIRMGINSGVQNCNADFFSVIAFFPGLPGIDNLSYSVHMLLFFY